MVDAPVACSVVLLCLSGRPGQAQQALEEDGLWVTPCHDLAQALRRLQTLRPDLLVLQVEGRRPEDWQACQRLAEAGGPPILVLVEDAAVETRLAALASGADDELARPLHPLELAARARALLRRAPAREPGSALLRHRDLELDLEGHQAMLQGQPLPLTPLEFRLLRALLESPQRTFSRDELLARVHVFDDRLPSERSVDLHVAELRQKLADSAELPRYIETVRGVGYRLAPGTGASPSVSLQAQEALSGRSALVTGGGRGIGRAIAETLARAGAAVVVAARSGDEVEAVASALRGQGHRARALGCDVTRPEQVRAAVAATVEWLGALDILVCNAGMAASVPVQQMDEALWERLLATNLSGVFYAARAALPHMLERRWGRIIAIASTASKIGYPYSAGYCAAKHGLLGLVRALALEVAQQGITVNAVCPSFAATGLARGAAQTIAQQSGRSVDEAPDALARLSPQHRPIEPDEVARVVLMLAGEGARGITG
ncbi:MAG: SDR family NAD(P)-dependent oxidoreductase, partial [Chloroflexi bacterium]|nr:SDR family NAD(P)-dependent oxidoreductase [Chloroflexota bacterium]